LHGLLPRSFGRKKAQKAQKIPRRFLTADLTDCTDLGFRTPNQQTQGLADRFCAFCAFLRPTISGSEPHPVLSAESAVKIA
jgi:hypothetical protein